MKQKYLILLLAFCVVSAFAQDNRREIPASWKFNLDHIDPIELPPLDLEEIQIQDSINDLDKSLPWRYGVTRPIILNLEETGVWTQLENGDRIWRVAIKSPDAINMSVNFNDFHLPEGGLLQLYNSDFSDSSKIYSKINNRDSKMLGSWFIRGDIITIEYYQSQSSQETAQLEIGSVIHGYRLSMLDDLVDSNDARGLNDSGDCNYDVNCSIGEDFDSRKDILKKAVALLNLGNGYLCSASLVNNTRFDKTPYLLTANHCLQDSDPSLWSVRFNWMSPNPVCGEVSPSSDLQSNFTMSGAEFISANEQSDFALVQLYNEIPSSWDVAFAGWDMSDSTPQYQIGIHHPNGDIMKICRDDDSAIKETANGTDVWLIKGVSAGEGNGWEIGTTESGSSGSPLFNENGRIIGQLYAGQSFCNGVETNGDYDVYGRMGISWATGSTPQTRLRDWLDPDGTGQNTIDVLQNALSTIDFEITGLLDIYPNPASEYVTIMNTRYPNLSYRFFDVLGKEIQAGNVSSSENRISVSNMQEGIYFLQLIDEETNNDITKKIIVEK